jgi:pimeloyl-ACP methyl ester carboxylesterase
MTTYALHRLAPTPRPPVVLIPGVGTGTGYFLPPGQTGLPQELIMAGYDVWTLDWRANPTVSWTIEDVASTDIPQAIRQVAMVTKQPVKIVAHCIGAIATMLAAVHGRLPDVTTILTNAVSLHPVIPRVSYLRMRTLLPLSWSYPTFLNPQWGKGTPGFWPTLFRVSAKVGLSGCADPTCKLIRWLYGEVWDHKNLTDTTHQWLLSQFHQVPVTFYQHLGGCIRRGHMELPAYPKTEARCVFLAGEENRCFLPYGQVQSWAWMQDHSTRQDHRFHRLNGYGHLDVFVGAQAEKDTFPLILKELAQ